jgi:hypothetical protein
LRVGEWRRLPSGVEVRVSVRRGYDCRERCEHEPPEPDSNHGINGDKWLFDDRLGDIGAVFECVSRINDGVIDPEWLERRDAEMRYARYGERESYSPSHGMDAMQAHRELPIVGATVNVHRKSTSSDDPECPIFGRCVVSFMGYLFSAEFFDKANADALLPFALHPVDAIDLAGVSDAMGPLWRKMGIVVAAATVE